MRKSDVRLFLVLSEDAAGMRCLRTFLRRAGLSARGRLSVKDCVWHRGGRFTGRV